MEIQIIAFLFLALKYMIHSAHNDTYIIGSRHLISNNLKCEGNISLLYNQYLNNGHKLNSQPSKTHTKNAIIYNQRGRALQDYLFHGKIHHVMGEVLVWSSLYMGLKVIGMEPIIIESLQELKRYNESAEYFFVDFYTIKESKHSLLTSRNLDKTFFVCFWGRSYSRITKPEWTHNNISIHPSHVLTPYEYDPFCDEFGCYNNTFLGYTVDKKFLGSSLVINKVNRTSAISFNSSIKFYLYGKRANDLEKQNSLINQLTSNGVNIYITSALDTNTTGVHNLGVLNSNDYESLLNHIKCLIGLNIAKYPPSVVDVLNRSLFLLAPMGLVPRQFHNHPNYVNTTSMSFPTLLSIMSAINNGTLQPTLQPLEEFSVTCYISRLCLLLHCNYGSIDFSRLKIDARLKKQKAAT